MAKLKGQIEKSISMAHKLNNYQNLDMNDQVQIGHNHSSKRKRKPRYTIDQEQVSGENFSFKANTESRDKTQNTK